MIKTILIIDDDDDDREMLCAVIDSLFPTVNCMEATNGEEALDLLTNKKSEKPDLIFLDLNMPRLNGKSCLIEIKKIRQYAIYLS